MKERIERLEQELAELKASLDVEEQGYTYWVFEFYRLNTPKIVKITLPEPIEFDSMGDANIRDSSLGLRYSYYHECYISDISAEDLRQRIIDAIEVVE